MNRKRMKILILVVIIGVFAYFGIAYANKSEYTGVGEAGYNFELEDLNGDLVRLSDYKGQVVILNYFATWCGPCVDEAPELEAFEKEYGDRFKLLIIDRGEPKDRVKKFIDEYKTTSTYLFDFNQKVSKEYNVIAQPETFVIDKEGIIKEHIKGPVTKEELFNLASKYE